jgi:hypothetical protein
LSLCRTIIEKSHINGGSGGLNVANKTQRNFRKQMNQIQKERSGTEVYSYVEDRHVVSYYQPRSFIRRTVGSNIFKIVLPICILALIFLGFQRYNNQGDISAYLDADRSLSLEANAIMYDSINLYNSTIKNKANQQDFINKNTESRIRLESIYQIVASKRVNSALDEFHKLNIEYYKTTLNQNAFLEQLLINPATNVKYIELEQASRMAQLYRWAALKKLLTENGIKFDENLDGSLTYYIKSISLWSGN